MNKILTSNNRHSLLKPQNKTNSLKLNFPRINKQNSFIRNFSKIKYYFFNPLATKTNQVSNHSQKRINNIAIEVNGCDRAKKATSILLYLPAIIYLFQITGFYVWVARARTN